MTGPDPHVTQRPSPTPAAQNSTRGAPMLSVQGLTTHLELRRGTVRAVDGVDLHVHEGETLGVVGESGSGKSMAILSILRLLPRQGGVHLGGKVLLDGVDLLQLPEKTMSTQYRGRKIAMISQDPLTSLNPVLRISRQLVEGMLAHGRRNPAEALKHGIDLLAQIGRASCRERVYVLV